MAKLIVMIVMLISLIVADNILVIIADKIIDSMIQSKMSRSLVKIAIFMIMIHIVGWVSLLVFVGYGVVHCKTARIAIKNCVNCVHSMLAR